MPIRHIVLIELADDTDMSEFQSIAQKADELLQAIPGVQHYEAGANVNPDPKRTLVGVTIVFDDFKAFQAYVAHPNHAAAVQMQRHLWKDVWIMQMEI